MPKQLFQIRNFNAGTISNPSEQDIPDDAASYSENLDPSNDDGKLKGIPTDSTKLLGSTFGDKLSEFALLTNGSQYDLIAYSKDNELRSINDFYGTPTLGLNSSGQISDDNVTMQVTNQEVHVGMGSGSTHITKWVGRIDSGQFDGSAPSGYQIDDAELYPPDQIPNFHKVIVIGSYIYGIEYQGKFIYKYDKSGVFVDKSNAFTKLQAICEHDSTHVWVYDNDIDFGKMYKVDITDWSKTVYCQITGWDTVSTDLESGCQTTDIFKTDNYLWFYNYTFVQFEYRTDQKVIYKIALSSCTNGASIIPTNVTWNITPGTADGQFNASYTGLCFSRTVFFKPPSVTDQVGIIGTGNDQVITYNSGAGTVGTNTFLLLAKEAVAFDNYVDGSTSAKWSMYIANLYIAKTEITSPIQLNNTSVYFIRHGASLTTNTNELEKMVAYAHSAWGAGTYNTTSQSAITNPSLGTPSNYNASTAIVCGEYSASQYLFYFFANAGGGRFSYKTTESSAITHSKISELIFVQTLKASSGDFLDNKIAYYKASYIYDGYQESPLSYMISTIETTADDQAINTDIKLFDTTISPRITAVNIYRADGLNTNSIPSGFYRLVTTIQIKNGWGLSSNSFGAFNNQQFLDTNIIGASYEANTGISETIEDTMVNYEISTQLNSEHFVGICYHPEIDDANRYIFKSKPFNFDQFDWSKDFVILPRQPIAIAGFAGRIYAFDENTTWRINPDGMYIEDTYEGIGCINKHAVTVTEYGMFYADRNGIYRHDGSRPIDISYPILLGATYAWQTAYFTDKIVYANFDSKRKTACFFFKTAVAGIQGCWAYSVNKNRWDLWLVSETVEYFIIGSFSGKNGEIFYSDNTDVKEFLSTTSTKRSWKFQTKQITAESPTIYKKWYKTIISTNGTNSLTLKADFDNTGSFTTLTQSGNECDLAKVRKKTAKFSIEGTNGREVDAFSVVLRDFIGLSQTQ